MLRRTTKIQLVLFVIITLVGVSYVGAKYVGFTRGVFGPSGCTVYADFKDSGGIFSSAELTYRGVTVGRVGKLELIKPSAAAPDGGVKVALELDNCNSPKIPQDSIAAVSDRSVVGEQYVNLVPPKDSSGPPIHKGYVFADMSKNTIPVAPKDLLTDFDQFSNSINTNNLATMITELGNAFAGRGNDLGDLLTAQNTLLQAAQQNLPATIALIDSAQTVLQTQLGESNALKSFSHNLNLLSQQLKASNPDFESLLTNGPADFQVLDSFITNNRTDLGVTFANLATTGELITRHLAGLEEVLELYPGLAGGAFTVLQHGVGRLGFVTNPGQPPDCGSPNQAREGYDNTKVRKPSDLSPQAPNTTAYCSNLAINPRGSAHVPGGDPMTTGGGGIAYPRVTTANTVRVGDDTSAPQLGDKSWLAILTDGVH